MREVVELYKRIGGFQALHVAQAYEVLKEALGEADVRFFSFTGNLVATGLREIIAEALRERLFNVVVTTAGALDHDIAKAMDGVPTRLHHVPRPNCRPHELHGICRLGHIGQVVLPTLVLRTRLNSPRGQHRPIHSRHDNVFINRVYNVDESCT